MEDDTKWMKEEYLYAAQFFIFDPNFDKFGKTTMSDLFWWLSLQ